MDGFLLNHLIPEHLEAGADGVALSNSDPVTGQAAWFDIKVRVRPASRDETGTWPVFESHAPGPIPAPMRLRYAAGGQVALRRSLRDVLFSRR